MSFLRLVQKVFLIVLSACLLSSCVTNKKFIFLQKDDINAKALPVDSVIRTYPLVQDDYRIQPEDILTIQFQSLTEREFDFFSRSTQPGGAGAGNLFLTPGAAALVQGELVDPQGNVILPVIGKVRVAGLTVFQAQDTLQMIANQYLENPLVKVRLINFRITLLGEVTREGTIIMPNNRVNLMEAIGLAGGLTDLADKRNVKLIRNINGETQVQYVNLLDEGFVNSPFYYVHQNDLLVVPALRQRPYRKYFGQNLSLVISSLSLLLITLTLINSNN